MRRSSVENDYLTWLVNRMNVVEGKNYGMLLRELYRVEFYSIIPYDEDRGADGLVLRHDWADEVGYNGSLDFGVARVLEVLIGISLRIEDQLFGGPWMDEWDYKRVFWDLLHNLGVAEFDGVLSAVDYEKVGTLLDQFLSKTSHCDTFANIYHFCVTPRNLQKMNLWSQMHLYIMEKWPVNSYF